MRLRDPAHIEELVALGVDGIEVIHPTAGVQDEARLRGVAARYGLLETGGTDFHAPDADRQIGVHANAEMLLRPSPSH